VLRVQGHRWARGYCHPCTPSRATVRVTVRKQSFVPRTSDFKVENTSYPSSSNIYARPSSLVGYRTGEGAVVIWELTATLSRCYAR
jgi:hypothetical protein